MFRLRPMLAAILCVSAAIRLAASDAPQTIPYEGRMGWSARLPDGRLMCWYVEGKEGEDPKIVFDETLTQKAFARYSSDNGSTWSEPQLLFEYPKGPGSYTGQVILCDRDGGSHLFGYQFFRWDPDNYDNAKSPLYHVMSTDGGKTWTPPAFCDFRYQYTGAVNSVIQLKSGRILVPVSGLSRQATSKFISTVSMSDDGGKTWRVSKGECAVTTGGGAQESGAVEPIVIELKDGRVWMFIRTQGGYLYESFSSDGGDTWTAPVPSRFVASNAPAAFLRLRDGRLLLVWPNSMGPAAVSYDRQVLCAAISDNDGRTWKGYREVARIGYDAQGQVAYPWLVEASDGSVLMAATDASWKVFLRRFGPNWLLDTKAEDHFADGLNQWMTIGTDGVSAIPHPDRPGAQVLALRKAKVDSPSGASYNFPFGAEGELSIRLRIEPGFGGARIALTDFFSLPGYAEPGRFGITVGPRGRLSLATARGQFAPSATFLRPGRWHTLTFAWDCAKGACNLTADGKSVGILPQLSPAPGVCYLRLWSAAERADEAGMLVESVSTSATP